MPVSYRWHPYAIDPKHDYNKEPMTLVEFFLDEAPEGARLRIVESGFDRIPPERRATLVARQTIADGVLEWNVILQGEAETVFFDY